METKVCTKCGRELPLGEYYSDSKSKDRLYSYCKECARKISRKNYADRKSNPQVSVQLPNVDEYFDERFKGITPRELIEELRQRGYTGKLEYRQVKVFTINV